MTYPPILTSERQAALNALKNLRATNPSPEALARINEMEASIRAAMMEDDEMTTHASSDIDAPLDAMLWDSPNPKDPELRQEGRALAKQILASEWLAKRDRRAATIAWDMGWQAHEAFIACGAARDDSQAPA